MTFKKSFVLLLALGLLLSLCGCSGSSSPQADKANGDIPQTQYDYQLKAGETLVVSDQSFDEPVTVTVDPASAIDGPLELRSAVNFENCAFNGGLTIVGDYHAMISLGRGCSFGEGSVVSCNEATEGVAQKISLENNLVKLLISCQGVSVETKSAIGVLSDGPDFILNGSGYSKAELAPDTAFLAVYSIYDGGEQSYVKLAVGEDDSVEFLN